MSVEAGHAEAGSFSPGGTTETALSSVSGCWDCPTREKCGRTAANPVSSPDCTAQAEPVPKPASTPPSPAKVNGSNGPPSGGYPTIRKCGRTRYPDVFVKRARCSTASASIQSMAESADAWLTLPTRTMRLFNRTSTMPPTNCAQSSLSLTGAAGKVALTRGALRRGLHVPCRPVLRAQQGSWPCARQARVQAPSGSRPHGR